MKIPKKINISGTNWKIVQTKVNPFPEIIDEDEGYWMGWCNSKDQTIYINTDKKMSDEKRLQVLFHEMAHAVMFESALTTGEYDTNEIYAQCFGKDFYNIFKQML